MKHLIKKLLREGLVEPDKVIGYHVTNKKNLNSIKKKGLEPRTPEDYGDSGDVKGVYLFKTKEDMDVALWNWLGERIEEWEEENGEVYEEIYLTVDLTGLDLYDSVEFEWVSLEHISPNRILDIGYP